MFLFFASGSSPQQIENKIIPEEIPDGLTLEEYDKVLLQHLECMSNTTPKKQVVTGGSGGLVLESGGSEHCYKQRVDMIEEFRND